MTREQRKEPARQLRAEDPGLEVVHPDEAGIDVGNSAHCPAVALNRDPEPVRHFGCFTAELHRLADWLKSCRIKTVVMQSTGVCWIPLYEVLDQHGLSVYLVNARQTRSPPGRKSDVQENQWLLKLHTYGLLNNSFQPGDEVRVRRTYWRQRADQVRAASICIQRMQTVLAEMNLQLANVISDLGGVSGMAIVRAILSVERDGEKLANLANRVIRASKETKYTATETAHALPRRIRKPKGNAHRFDLETEPQRIMGVDLTRIDGIDVLTTQTLISETGTDMGRRKTEARSASWLGLCTDNRISGDKILCCGTRSVLNKTATALRMAATAPC